MLGRRCRIDLASALVLVSTPAGSVVAVAVCFELTMDILVLDFTVHCNRDHSI